MLLFSFIIPQHNFGQDLDDGTTLSFINHHHFFDEDLDDAIWNLICVIEIMETKLIAICGWKVNTCYFFFIIPHNFHKIKMMEVLFFLHHFSWLQSESKWWWHCRKGNATMITCENLKMCNASRKAKMDHEEINLVGLHEHKLWPRHVTKRDKEFILHQTPFLD